MRDGVRRGHHDLVAEDRRGAAAGRAGDRHRGHRRRWPRAPRASRRRGRRTRPAPRREALALMSWAAAVGAPVENASRLPISGRRQRQGADEDAEPLVPLPPGIARPARLPRAGSPAGGAGGRRAGAVRTAGNGLGAPRADAATAAAGSRLSSGGLGPRVARFCARPFFDGGWERRAPPRFGCFRPRPLNCAPPRAAPPWPPTGAVCPRSGAAGEPSPARPARTGLRRTACR